MKKTKNCGLNYENKLKTVKKTTKKTKKYEKNCFCFEM